MRLGIVAQGLRMAAIGNSSGESQLIRRIALSVGGISESKIGAVRRSWRDKTADRATLMRRYGLTADRFEAVVGPEMPEEAAAPLPPPWTDADRVTARIVAASLPPDEEIEE